MFQDVNIRYTIRLLDELTVDNDPSAGSPTETLLRLLLPLDNLVCKVSKIGTCSTARYLLLRPTHQLIQSVGATGGVYKGQGRIQCKLMTNTYWIFLVYMLKFQSMITNKESFKDFIAFFELSRVS